MFPRFCPLSSHPHVRDLLGVVVYCTAIMMIAAAVYAGVQAAAPVAVPGVLSVTQALDELSQPDTEPRALSNFEQWLAARDAAKRSKPAPVKAVERPSAPRVLPGPTGIAAAAKAKAQAEFGGSAAAKKSARDGRRDDAALPSGAQPVEQTGYTPPPVIEIHRVY